MVTANMLDYKIPGDSLEKRQKDMMFLMTPDEKTGYMDGEVYQTLRPYVKDKHMTQADKYWLGVAYSVSYSCSTAIRFFEEFPDFKNINFDKMLEFWKAEKPTMYFNPDRRYLKNMDSVIPAIRNIHRLSGGDLDGYITPLLKQGFNAMYKEIISHWQFYGPMGAYLFFDTIWGYSPELISDPDHLDWFGSGQTVVEGMAHYLGYDTDIQNKSYREHLDEYNTAAKDISERSGFPLIVVESNLCYLRKFFKASRYMGYYADRELEEYNQVADILKDKYGVDIWHYRELTCPEELRGELHGWTGIRKELCKRYLQTGEM